MGWDLHSLTHWSRLERAVRILNADDSVAAVAGSRRQNKNPKLLNKQGSNIFLHRNLTGHWESPCRQVRMTNYVLEITPGYEHSR